MIGYLTIFKIINNLLKQGLVGSVFHSVEIHDENGARFPVYRKGDELVYVGIDDTKIMNCYIRELSPFVVSKQELIGGGKKMYKGKVGYRAVFFNDFEKRNHGQLLTELMDFTFYPHIELTKLITNSEQLLKEEAKVKDFTFGAETFYKAIDFTVLVIFVEDKCKAIIDCGNWINPISKATDDNTYRDFSDDFS